MTHEAMEILKAARDGDGDIIRWRSLANPGVQIRAGAKTMIPDDADAETVALWEGGLEDLRGAGYIGQTDTQGDCFAVTREGFAALRAPVSQATDPHRRVGF